MKRILLTGGAGFIGSHTFCSLIEKGFDLLIIDSLVNSSEKSLEGVKAIFKNQKIDINEKVNFFRGDLRDKKFLDSVFKSSINKGKPIDGVIHFAGLKAVAESVINPIKYWDHNVLGSINLIQSMNNNNCKTIVFSSSAAVYGNNSEKIISEKSKINPINPYGSTKFAVENLLNDIYQKKSSEWKIAILRYFNPIGAHPSGLIGENPLQKPNNIFPKIINAAYEKVKLEVFGNDWPSHDGTCIRDYIHVMDLAEGHLKALDYLFKNDSQLIKLNLGTGCGYSVLELIKTFEKVNSVKVPFEISNRREGDVFKLVANNEKAIKTIDWFPNRSLEDMCKDGWNWKIMHPMGYQNN